MVLGITPVRLRPQAAVVGDAQQHERVRRLRPPPAPRGSVPRIKTAQRNRCPSPVGGVAGRPGAWPSRSGRDSRPRSRMNVKTSSADFWVRASLEFWIFLSRARDERPALTVQLVGIAIVAIRCGCAAPTSTSPSCGTSLYRSIPAGPRNPLQPFVRVTGTSSLVPGTDLARSRTRASCGRRPADRVEPFSSRVPLRFRGSNRQRALASPRHAVRPIDIRRRVSCDPCRMKRDGRPARWLARCWLSTLPMSSLTGMQFIDDLRLVPLLGRCLGRVARMSTFSRPYRTVAARAARAPGQPD